METEEYLLRHRIPSILVGWEKNYPMFEIKQTGRYWKEINC